jgi:hypothetical protein
MREEAAERAVLAWPYIAILIGEVAVLGLLVAAFPSHPPLSYEIGWIGVASMLVMQLYSVRRRLRVLRNLGSLRSWLDAHIFLGLQGFVFIGYHSVGVSPNANLAALNFALVGTVIVSGLTGRYLYGFIPRARAGNAIEYAELVATLGETAPPAALRRECRGLRDLVVLDAARRRLLRDLRRDRTVTAERSSTTRRSILLASRISALEVAERWFSRWTLFHRPLAFLLLGITTLHVLAHYAYAT